MTPLYIEEKMNQRSASTFLIKVFFLFLAASFRFLRMLSRVIRYVKELATLTRLRNDGSFYMKDAIMFGVIIIERYQELGQNLN